jgi:hypothetical protein
METRMGQVIVSNLFRDALIQIPGHKIQLLQRRENRAAT